jgi:lipopolysaccharide/colanic/teichoic acid biosynthesis glycosyltransferase
VAAERAPELTPPVHQRARRARIIAFPVQTPIGAPTAPCGFYARRLKRPLDVAFGFALFVAVLPLVAAIALAVLVTSGPPVFYASERLGRGGRPFQMWKFRTMVRDADAVLQSWHETRSELAGEIAASWKVRNDPRITVLGRFLRRSSLDELPQFVNVLRGEMSLVGPRPYLPREIAGTPLAVSILAVRPGLTGPFQVRGRNALDPRSRMQIEAGYANQVSAARDLLYLGRTMQPLLTLNGH